MEINKEAIESLSAADISALIIMNTFEHDEIEHDDELIQKRTELRSEIIALQQQLEKIKNNIFTH